MAPAAAAAAAAATAVASSLRTAALAAALVSLFDGHLQQSVLATQVCGAHEGTSCEDDSTSSLLQTRVQPTEQQQQQKEEEHYQHEFGLLQQLSEMLSHGGGMSETERAAVEDRWPFNPRKPQPEEPVRDTQLPDAPGADDELWGGPSVAYSNEGYTKETFNLEDVTKAMTCPGNESGLPEDFQGIWWMDQFGASSVGKDPDYPYAMVGLGETLMSFGGAKMVKGNDATCITPVTLYHGREWAFYNNGAGMDAFNAHDSSKNTLTFCLNNDGTVQIRAKELRSNFFVGPIKIPSHLLDSLKFEDAGHDYLWQPSWLMDMKMVKQPWGWDRVTTVVDKGVHTSGNPALTMLVSLLSGLMPESHYPLLQIIDGQGQKTKYYHELEAVMADQVKNKKVPADGQYFVPVPVA
mmetsp:Transcript_29121/g.63226  ORF Transcript_29121/g.63226 Transcript_29121/m.63226 type:complete len:408 (+) Transcript_29121:113-1336(+)